MAFSTLDIDNISYIKVNPCVVPLLSASDLVDQLPGQEHFILTSFAILPTIYFYYMVVYSITWRSSSCIIVWLYNFFFFFYTKFVLKYIEGNLKKLEKTEFGAALHGNQLVSRFHFQSLPEPVTDRS